MLVLTKSVRDPKEELDGIRILVMRHFPWTTKGFSKKNGSYDFWWRDLSPSADDLRAYHEGKMTIEQVCENLLRRIKTDQIAIEHLKRIDEMRRRQNVTLLCQEREGQPCHRLKLKEILDERTGTNYY